ncbi:MAG: helix-turn-helix domain-containing protein [Nitrospira sp.]
MKRTLLSVKEVAHELGVSVQSIRRAYWSGSIPAYRVNKMLRFDLERVQQIFLAKGSARGVRASSMRPAAPAGGASRKKAPAQ